MASQSQPAGSVSKIECEMKVSGRGSARASFFRHLAPVTVIAVVHILPLDSRVTVQRPMVSLFTQLRVGVEKPRAQFERGDVAFLPSGGLICVFTGSARSDRPLNPLGKVDTAIELLEAVRPGDVVRLEAPK